MRVNSISLDVETTNPNELPQVGETLTVTLPRMEGAVEFEVSETSYKRRWVDEQGDDEGYIYTGACDLERVITAEELAAIEDDE